LFDNDDDDGLGRVSSDTPVVVSILIVKQPTVFHSKNLAMALHADVRVVDLDWIFIPVESIVKYHEVTETSQ
jgi:hypothetical protein